AVAGNNAANVADAWDEVGVDEALCGGGTGDPGDPPAGSLEISNVTSYGTSGRSFNIDWTTNEASDSAVQFTCCGTYTDGTMTTSHSMGFNGSKNATYEYYVTSSNSGGSATSGPYIHQN
ncbi:MAG TPA: peptidase M4, partial [Anaerolineae bacterium]|nr:peptidase M4 [Anaerolineae bacterium]